MTVLRPCPLCGSPVAHIDLDGRMPKLTCPGCGRSVASSTLGSSCASWNCSGLGYAMCIDILPCPRCGSGKLRLRVSPPMVSCRSCGRLRDAFSQELCINMWNGGRL